MIACEQNRLRAFVLNKIGYVLLCSANKIGYVHLYPFAICRTDTRLCTNMGLASVGYWL